MKKINITVIFIFLVSFSFGQDYELFSNRFEKIKNDYRSFLHSTESIQYWNGDKTQENYESQFEENAINKLKDKNRNINSDIESLEKEFKQYIIDNSLNQDKKFDNLLTEINEFSNFFHTTPSFSCLSYFNKFISELGGTSTVLKQSNDVKIYVAKIGSFKFFYIYAINDFFYAIKINSTIQKYGQYLNNSTWEFNILLGTIKIFKVSTIKDKSIISKLSAIKKDDYLKSNSYGCENEFPRK